MRYICIEFQSATKFENAGYFTKSYLWVSILHTRLNLFSCFSCIESGRMSQPFQ